jgi:hypothetical protein
MPKIPAAKAARLAPLPTPDVPATKRKGRKPSTGSPAMDVLVAAGVLEADPPPEPAGALYLNSVSEGDIYFNQYGDAMTITADRPSDPATYTITVTYMSGHPPLKSGIRPLKKVMSAPSLAVARGYATHHGFTS